MTALMQLHNLIGMAFLAGVPAQLHAAPQTHQLGGQGKKAQRAPNLVDLPDDYVRFARLPEGGTQPRLRRDQEGTAVVLYFHGGDLLFTRTTDEAVTFGPSIRVNTDPGSVPTLEGAHLAAFDLGRDGRGHVVWTSDEESPHLMYAREGADGAFAVQDLGTSPGMCRGAAVTADSEGRVYVFYGALDPSLEPTADVGYGTRTWVRRTSPEGVFGTPLPAGQPRGVSFECPMDAVYDPWSKTVYACYRTAYSPPRNEKILSRDLRLLSTEDGGETFADKLTDNWRYKRLLVAPARLDLEPLVESVGVAWEGRGSVYSSIVRRNYNMVALALEPKDGRTMWRTAPAATAGLHKNTLIAWVERPIEKPEEPRTMGWKVFDNETRGPLGGGRTSESCGDSFPAVLPRSDGGFTILY